MTCRRKSALVGVVVAHPYDGAIRELVQRLKYQHQIAIAGQRILIIHDVLTTGATLGEAARVLKVAGAKSVWGAVVAKH